MKKALFLFGFIILSFFIIPNVDASAYILLNANKYFRDKPGGNPLTSVVENGILEAGFKVNLIDRNAGSGYGCNNNWYKVSYNGHEGYICSSGQVVQEVADVDMSGDFETDMLSKGFPKTYLPYLKKLHEKYPNWTFSPLKTGILFHEAVKNENIGDISVVDDNTGSLCALDSNGNCIASNEAGWYIASYNTVSYYLDPRNFLSEEYIYMFENTAYNRTVQTRNAVSGVVSGSFLQTSEYIDLLMRAANDYNVSPVYLASRIRQEKGTNGGVGTDGAPFTFSVDQNCLVNNGYTNPLDWNAKNSCGTDETYSGIYNFYNIGAYSSYKSAVIRGLIWAKGGFDSSVTTYMRPWNTKEKAILGGASYIVSKFISKGQNTLYLQRFNVGPDAVYSHYTNQYMTNIRAHASEAYKVYKSYRDNNLLGVDYEFLIPVYNEMPGENDEILPDQPDQKPEEVPVLEIATAVTSAGYKLNNTIISGIPLNQDINEIQARLHSIHANMNIYEFKDKYGRASKGIVGTGDTISISNGVSNASYTAVLYGDNNGDGKITILDLLRVQKYLLGNSNLTSTEVIASDTNHDGKVDIVDLLRIQKYLLGSISIEQ